MSQYKLEYREIGISISNLRKDPDKIREWHCQIVLTIPMNGQIEDKILGTQVYIADNSSHALSQAKNRAKQEVDSILDIGLWYTVIGPDAKVYIIEPVNGQTETELVLPPGKHTLQLLLGNYAHIPHDKLVLSDKITITVK